MRISSPSSTSRRRSGISPGSASSLKLKVAASIVAISSIHLLGAFMEAETVPNDKLIVLVIMHLTFVVSALLLTVMDRLVVEHER